MSQERKSQKEQNDLDGILQMYEEVDLSSPANNPSQAKPSITIPSISNPYQRDSPKLSGYSSTSDYPKNRAVPQILPSQARLDSASARKGNRKKYYGCFRTRRAALLGLAAIVILLVTMIILLFFLLPRSPAVSISAISKANQLSVVSRNNVLSVDASLEVQASVFNQSYKTQTFPEISVKGYWIKRGEPSSSKLYPLGNGIKEQVQIAARTALEISVQYSIKHEGNYRSDEIYVDFLSRCTDPTSEERVIQMAYYITAGDSTTKAIHSLGCPVNRSQISQILAGLTTNNGNMVIPIQL